MSRLKFISPSSGVLAGNTGSTMYERYTAAAGQVTMKTKATYSPGSHQLHVYKNGQYQYVDVDYFEIDDHTIQFLQPLDETDSILLSVDGVYSERLHEVQKAIKNQTTFVLSANYHMGLNTLLVYLNGMLQDSDAYTEVDEKTVRFMRPMRGTETVIFHEQV